MKPVFEASFDTGESATGDCYVEKMSACMFLDSSDYLNKVSVFIQQSKNFSDCYMRSLPNLSHLEAASICMS